MGFLKAKGVSVTVAGREFEISFNMNVIEAIFEKFGTLNDFQKALRGSDACGNLRTSYLDSFRHDQRCHRRGKRAV